MSNPSAKSQRFVCHFLLALELFTGGKSANPNVCMTQTRHIFKMTHCGSVFPLERQDGIAYLCSDQARSNFSHVFSCAVHPPLHLGQPAHTCTADPHTPVQHLDQTLTTFPMLAPHCARVSNTGRCGHLELRAGWCLISQKAEHVSRWCFPWSFEGVEGIMGKQMAWRNCALKGTCGHLQRGSV